MTDLSFQAAFLSLNLAIYKEIVILSSVATSHKPMISYSPVPSTYICTPILKMYSSFHMFGMQLLGGRGQS